jgi:hypothetical protein
LKSLTIEYQGSISHLNNFYKKCNKIKNLFGLPSENKLEKYTQSLKMIETIRQEIIDIEKELLKNQI